MALDVLSPLVETTWLASHSKDVILLDVQKKITPDMPRIEGAILVSWGEVRAKKEVGGVQLIKMLPDKASFEALMQKLGVNNNSAIVITSTSSKAAEVFFATRLYWQLKYYGHDNVALLNGGNGKWFKEKRATTTKQYESVKKGNFIAKVERKEILATTIDVKEAIKKHSVTLIDARSQDMYLGLFYKKKYVGAAGHLSKAKSVDGDMFLLHGTVKTFHPTDKIQMALEAKGVGSKAASISYCNSGHLASGLWFIEHELLGNKKAKLYDGSMHAWTKDKNRAVVKMKME